MRSSVSEIVEALVEEGHLAQSLSQRVVVVLGGGEDGLVGQKMNFGATALAGARLAQFADRIAATEVHLPGVAVAPDLDVELLREGVDATDADSVQAAGDLVGGSVEFAAGMELGQHHLHGGHHLAVGQRHHVHGNSAAVIDDGDRVVHVNDDVDLFGVSGQRLVHRVVHHLVDQVVQAHLAGRADVHGRTQADGLEAFEDFDVFAGVAAVICRGAGWCFRGSVAIGFRSQCFRF